MWLAKDSLLDRKVICKRIDQRFARRADWRSTLVALADAALKSRTIPQLFGVQTVGDSCWLIQEFVQGTTLEMALQDRPTRLGDRSILLVAMDLLAAAVAFRAVGLVHGDINPANVLIDATGRARVIDFNCAALIGEKLLGVGVPGFRRPDAGPSPSADPLDDAFAIGCLIFWLLGCPCPTASGVWRVSCWYPPPRVQRARVDWKPVVAHRPRSDGGGLGMYRVARGTSGPAAPRGEVAAHRCAR